MAHGVHVLLYNLCVMGHKYCTTHGPWGTSIVVQPMSHGVGVPLYNP